MSLIFKKLLYVLALVMIGLGASDLHAQKSSKVQKRKYVDTGFAAAASTTVNFQDTMIDGKMQAPQGFFLQGRSPQGLSQMVRLRPNFKKEMRTSTSLAKAVFK